MGESLLDVNSEDTLNIGFGEEIDLSQGLNTIQGLAEGGTC